MDPVTGMETWDFMERPPADAVELDLARPWWWDRPRLALLAGELLRVEDELSESPGGDVARNRARAWRSKWSSLSSWPWSRVAVCPESGDPGPLGAAAIVVDTVSKFADCSDRGRLVAVCRNEAVMSRLLFLEGRTQTTRNSFKMRTAGALYTASPVCLSGVVGRKRRFDGGRNKAKLTNQKAPWGRRLLRHPPQLDGISLKRASHAANQRMFVRLPTPQPPRQIILIWRSSQRSTHASIKEGRVI